MALFNLTEPQFNIVKKTARAAVKECKEAAKQGGYSDAQNTAILRRHYEPIKPLIPYVKFVWLAGYLNNRWGKDFDRF